jgi:hypothetical protein
VLIRAPAAKRMRMPMTPSTKGNRIIGYYGCIWGSEGPG